MSSDLELYLIWILAAVGILAGSAVLFSFLTGRNRRARRLRELRRKERLQGL